jgi:site-specific DNA recombinase
MANPEFFQKEFQRYATNGFIGDPNGEPAYGYMRVSSKGQAEEGRSGLPRQVEHLHDKALIEHCKISWDMIFADDHTGFEFEDRPQLQKLLSEVRTNKRRANKLVIENIDRLSRNAEWHQGYLLEQLKKNEVFVYSWKDIGNRITRTVLGVVAQEGMEDSKERMKIGTLKKLESGRITSKRPAYGYQFVDSLGNPNGKVKRDTHYGIYEPEAEIVRIIFNQVSLGIGLKTICDELENLYPPPKNCKIWYPTIISRFIKSELYKGIYIGNRLKLVKVEQTKSQGKLINEKPKMKSVLIERPKEEWKYAPVPPIVSEELWQRANDMIVKNSTMAKRNSKNNYLLTGLMKCATCGYSYVGYTNKWKNTPNGKLFLSSKYHCASNVQPKVIKDSLQCNQGVISGKKIETEIWKIICETMENPDPMIKALERVYNNEDNAQINSQINHIKNQIESCDLEDRRVKKGYNSGVYSEQETIEEREIIRQRKEKLESSLSRMQGRMMTYHQFLAQKERILEISESFRANKIDMDTPFELKRAVVKTLIDNIVINTRTQFFEVTGILKGTWSLADKNSNGDNSLIGLHTARKTLLNVEWKVQFYFDNPEKSSLFIVPFDSFSNVIDVSPMTSSI